MASSLNTRVYLYGKCNSIIDIHLDYINQLERGDTSELYTTIAYLYPENDWEDIC
jgi:hypothetical protein